VRERDHGGQSPKIDVDAVPKRPTYKQDWPAYGIAQRTEKHRFLELLADLCRGIAEPEWEATPGPKPHLLRDSAFAVAYKVYEGFSSRRFERDLQEAHQQGYVLGIEPVFGPDGPKRENSDVLPLVRPG
jgi:hypothetical protein